MADDKLIIRVDFQGLDTADKQVGELDQQIQRLTKTYQGLKKQTKDGTALTAEQSEQMGKLQIRIKNLRTRKSELLQSTTKLNKAQRANTNTIEGLEKRNAQLVAQMKKVNINTKQGQQQLALMRKEVNANDAKIRQFNESLNRHQHNVGNYRGALDGARNGLAAMAAGITAAVMAFQRINQMMQESIELFKAQELAERQLEFAAGDASQALIAQAAALQQQTTFGDEAIIQMQALLASFGSTAEEIKSLTPLILDYAAASGQDLSQAATKVNNILNGTSTTLRGTSIRLSETADANERYNAVLQEFTKFQGAAAAVADSQTGKLQQLENKYNDQKEVLGRDLIPIKIKFQEALIETVNVLRELTFGIGEIVGTFGKLASAVFGVNKAYAANEQQTIKVNAAIAETTKAVSQESAEIASLFEILTDETKAKELKDAAIRQLNASYGQYLGNIDLEKAGIDELNKLEADLINTMTKRILIQRKEEDLVPLLEKRVDILQAINEKEKEREQQYQDFLNMSALEREALAETNKQTNIILTSTGHLIDMNSDLEAELASVDQAIKDLTSGYDGLLDGLGETLTATETFTTQTGGATDAINEQAKAMEGPAAKAYELAKGADALTKAEKELAESLKSIDQLLDEVDLSFEKEEIEEPAIVSQADLAAQKLEKVSMILESLKGISLDSAITQVSKMTDETTNLEKTVVLVGASVTALNDILATRFANQKARIEQQALTEKEAIESSTMSEEQKRIAIERAEQKKATAIEKIEQKQAKQEKANAIIQSIINTALGITAALKNPLTAPFVIPIIATIGAVQTGIIAAQQFADGGQVADLGSGEGGAIPVAAQNIPALGNGDNVLATVKTGEVILNESQQARLKALTGSANVFRAIGVPGFADGGLVPSFSNTNRSTASRIEQSNAQAIGAMQSIKVVNVATETAGMATMVNNIETEATFG